MSGYLKFPSINSVTIAGRLVRDVEMKYSQNNVGFTRICIAVNHYTRDESGNYIEETSFIDTVAFGKTAQMCVENLKKGSPVLFEGYLKTRSYTDQNNQNRKITEINITKVYPLERDENYVPNTEYKQNNHSNNQNTQSSYQKPNNTFTQPEEPDNFPTYDPSSYGEVNTENDVPF